VEKHRRCSFRREWPARERFRESAIAGLPINHCQRVAFPSRASHFSCSTTMTTSADRCSGTFSCCLDHNHTGKTRKGLSGKVAVSAYAHGMWRPA
jgi:hypothetical protein